MLRFYEKHNLASKLFLFNRITATCTYVRHRFLGLCSSLITFRIFVHLLRFIAQNVAELFNLTNGIRVRVRASHALDVSRGSLMGLEI
jgi:hypothetical protein